MAPSAITRDAVKLVVSEIANNLRVMLQRKEKKKRNEFGIKIV